MVSFDEPIENAWVRSHAMCECRRVSHRHLGRCSQVLVWEHRGQEPRRGAWEAHHNSTRTTAGWEASKQCEILCLECYKQTAKATTPKMSDNREAAARQGATSPSTLC